MKRGTLVDATIIAAPSSIKNQSDKRDPEMSSTRKGKQYSYSFMKNYNLLCENGL